MNTSETYIKMCEKAEEIQKDHKWEYGDYFLAEHRVWCIGDASFHYQNIKDGVPIRDILPIASMQTDDLEGARISDKYIWLPRQDQLQEMVIEHWGESDVSNKVVVCLDEFQDWVLNKCDGLDWSYSEKNLSMEQLWLAFVMKEKYEKAWDSGKEEWIKYS